VFRRPNGWHGSSADELPDLSKDDRKRLNAIVDPAADQRAALIRETLSKSFEDMTAKLEGPIREGLARSYAVRFDERQLADINAFFATPTGRDYASQSMEAFTDPQTMGAMMQAMPAMMRELPQSMQGIQEKAAKLPGPRGFEDLSAAERSELATAFGITVDQLREDMERAAERNPAE